MRLIVNIDVPELKPAIKFYCAAFDLKVNRVLDVDVAELVGGPCKIYLLAKAERTPIDKSQTDVRRYSRHWTPIHFDVVVDDIEQATIRALSAGAKKESECVEWRGSRCVTFSDPFGHGFCFIKFLGDSYE